MELKANDPGNYGKSSALESPLLDISNPSCLIFTAVIVSPVKLAVLLTSLNRKCTLVTKQTRHIEEAGTFQGSLPVGDAKVCLSACLSLCLSPSRSPPLFPPPSLCLTLPLPATFSFSRCYIFDSVILILSEEMLCLTNSPSSWSRPCSDKSDERCRLQPLDCQNTDVRFVVCRCVFFSFMCLPPYFLCLRSFRFSFHYITFIFIFYICSSPVFESCISVFQAVCYSETVFDIALLLKKKKKNQVCFIATVIEHRFLRSLLECNCIFPTTDCIPRFRRWRY